ncbi:glycoside hydrolase family 5 protein [Streptomyces sp. NPDC058662]|uniref:glycoside hydrolase family 5 protein n=1 Tax=Streptomyces sp. NPDC058662 TaxID=3346583 RepID=UPI0036696594
MRPRTLAAAASLIGALLVSLTTAPSSATGAPVTHEARTASVSRAAGGPNDPLTADTAAVPPQLGATPVGVNGQLAVCGTKLCNRYGKPVQLRGMSTHGTQWYAQRLTGGSLDALATDWKADVLRVSTYVQEGGYETDPRRFTDLAHSLIEQATARGMYVIVDWHMLDPGDPHVNLAKAKTFFSAIANRHQGKNNVLYEVANEPSGVSWGRIKSYAEQIIPVIRGIDPDAPVLVGTRAWSSFGVSEGGNENEVVANQVRASNIMYTFHFYADSHREEYLETLSRAADRIPVFVTEFGTQNYAGEGGNDFAMSQKYLDLMAAKKISWVNWNFSDDGRTGAVFTPGTCAANGPWAGTSRLKPAGVWIRERVRGADDFPTG